VWYENAASPPLEALQRTVVLDGEHRNKPKIFIALAKRAPITSDN